MSDPFPVTIYHNPMCGTSRKVVAAVEAKGYVPTIVEYLKTGWTADQLTSLFGAMHKTPRELLRKKSGPAEDLGLLEPAATDEEIVRAMVSHPILVERPIVVTPKGVKLCRPAETVRLLL
jgi:arsenate reductase